MEGAGLLGSSVTLCLHLGCLSAPRSRHLSSPRCSVLRPEPRSLCLGPKPSPAPTFRFYVCHAGFERPPSVLVPGDCPFFLYRLFMYYILGGTFSVHVSMYNEWGGVLQNLRSPRGRRNSMQVYASYTKGGK